MKEAKDIEVRTGEGGVNKEETSTMNRRTTFKEETNDGSMDFGSDILLSENSFPFDCEKDVGGLMDYIDGKPTGISEFDSL